MKSIIVILLVLAGCSTTSVDRVSGYGQVQPVKPEMAAGSLVIHFYRAPEWDWTAAEKLGAQSLRAQLNFDLGVDIMPKDGTYVCIPHDVADWAWYQVHEARQESVPQIIEYLVATYGADPNTRRYDEYIADAMDCDDAADQQAALVRLLIGVRYGIQNATPAIGTVHVEQLVEWGNVPAGGHHALCWEATTALITTVREAQNGIRGPAEHYPNKAVSIFGMILDKVRKVIS